MHMKIMVVPTAEATPTTPTSTTYPFCTDIVCDVDEQEREEEEEKKSCETSDVCVEGCAAYGLVCPCDARAAGKAAHGALAKLRENSALFGDDDDDECCNNNKMRKLRLADIEIGEKLGEGGFCLVKACTLKSDPSKKLAIKYLKRKVMVHRRHFEHGAADLAQEAYFLSVLDHPHIISLHGVTAGDVQANVAMGKECAFFITIDRLYDTLEKRLERWRNEHEKQNQHQSIFSRIISSEYKEKKKQECLERVRIALDIADAMEYLHSKNIIFRDLKPDNIGFDENGVLKLLDFGLAKELKRPDEHADGRYQLTGNTGSRRYMAPEVAKELPYNKSVDTYSFGILLHELLTAEKPFLGYSSGKHMSLVVVGGERPKMDHRHTACWPMNLQFLLKRCWSPFPASRPDFTEIKQTLQEVIDSNEPVSDHMTPTPEASATATEEIYQQPTTTETFDNEHQHHHNGTKIEPPVGGFASLLRPIRAKAKSHGSAPNASSPMGSPRNSPVKGQATHAKRGISLGWLRK